MYKVQWRSKNKQFKRKTNHYVTVILYNSTSCPPPPQIQAAQLYCTNNINTCLFVFMSDIQTGTSKAPYVTRGPSDGQVFNDAPTLLSVQTSAGI